MDAGGGTAVDSAHDDPPSIGTGRGRPRAAGQARRPGARRARYAVAITPAIAALIDRADPADPIARQFVPDVAELDTPPDERADPIGDDAHSPVEGIVHRYPDRVLLKLVHVCAVYCRFCFRREMVGPGKQMLSPEQARRGARLYRGAAGDLGGDPHRRRSADAVAAPPGDVIGRIAAIDHVKVVRLHTRVPVVSPERSRPRWSAR